MSSRPPCCTPSSTSEILIDVDKLGFNYRMSELHAAIGIIQLKKFNKFLKKRSINFKYLEQKLKKLKNVFVVPNLVVHTTILGRYR